LDCRGDFPDFIQKDAATVCFLKTSHFIVYRSGKSALDMSEQFTLKQILHQGGAVDDNHRLGGICPAVMDGLGNQFFTGTAFTGNQNRTLGVGQIIDQVKNTSHFF